MKGVNHMLTVPIYRHLFLACIAQKLTSERNNLTTWCQALILLVLHDVRSSYLVHGRRYVIGEGLDCEDRTVRPGSARSQQAQSSHMTCYGQTERYECQASQSSALGQLRPPCATKFIITLNSKSSNRPWPSDLVTGY